MASMGTYIETILVFPHAVFTWEKCNPILHDPTSKYGTNLISFFISNVLQFPAI